MTHDSLIGTKVRHGSITGKVVQVTEETVLIQPDKGKGSVIAVTIPEHLR